MSDLTIRRFEPDDGPAIRQLHEVAMRDAEDFVEGAPEPDLADVPGHYLDGDGEFLVGTVEGDVVAMVAFHPVEEWLLADRFDFDRRTAELTRMRIDPGHQRRGFGRAISDELERWARDDGYEQLVLDVSVDNDDARAFYEAAGFAYVRTVELQALGETFPLAVYRKGLSE